MFWDLSWRNLAIAVIVALAIIGVISLLTDNESAPPDAVVGYMPLVTPTPIPPSVLVADIDGPGSSSRNSALVMIQGMVDRRLVIWPLMAGGEPLEVDRNVGYGPLLADPTSQYVFYSTARTAMVLDVAARRALIVGELGEDTMVLSAQWSPDGRAVSYVVRNEQYRIAYYTRADGSILAQEMRRMPQGLGLDTGWLADGRPVSIYVGMGPVGGLETRYEAFDPATGDSVLLPPGVEVFQTYKPQLSPDGTQQLFPMSTWEQAEYKSGCRQSSLGVTSDNWLGLTLTGLSENYQTAFYVQNVYLDQPVWLRDGRVIMRGIADESCPSTPTGLYIARRGERPSLLIQSQAMYFTDEYSHLQGGPVFAISPDQTLVAWVANDDSQRTTTIYLTALDDPESTHPLFRMESPLTGMPPFHFRNSVIILDFIWLP